MSRSQNQVVTRVLVAIFFASAIGCVSDADEGPGTEQTALGFRVSSHVQGETLRTEVWDVRAGVLVRSTVHRLAEMKDLGYDRNRLIAALQQGVFQHIRRHGSFEIVGIAKGSGAYASASCPLDAYDCNYEYGATLGPGPVTLNWGDNVANWAGARHDYNYGPDSTMTRLQADNQLFNDMWSSSNVITKALAPVFYGAVRLFGWLFFTGNDDPYGQEW